MRALLSVYDKRGVVELAAALVGMGWEIVSTGGTRRALAGAGVAAREVGEVTGFPEMLDGRVKTLHPAIHGGLLARRDDPAHGAALAAAGIEPIGLLAVNLYPFGATVAEPGVGLAEAIEQIDIGGPAMLRGAAKNHAGVVVVCDPGDYGVVLSGLRANDISPEARRRLAAKAFAHTAAYDAVVAEYLRGDGVRLGAEDGGGGGERFPTELTIPGRKAADLRYGENPHQGAAAYRRLVAGPAAVGVLDAEQVAGKALSFNNLLDADAGWSAVVGLGEPAACVVKHTIPCGLAVRGEVAEAFAAAVSGDPVSAFGGIVAVNRPLDRATAEAVAEGYFEVVVAPGFAEEAVAVLGRKRGLRLLRMPVGAGAAGGVGAAWDVRPIAGGLLVQEADGGVDGEDGWRVVTERAPSAAEWADLRFAWGAVRHVKSNAIVLARERAVVGVGAGQPNRLGSVRIAAETAGARAVGAVLASDAFFPFADGVEAAAAIGVGAVIQPGGSVRDGAVVAAADGAGMAMVVTGRRHFRH